MRFALLVIISTILTLEAQELRHPPEYPEFLRSLELDETDKALGIEYKEPDVKIVERNGWLWSDEKDQAATRNSEALFYVLQNDYARAREIFEEIVLKAPHFFPARYNLGRIYLFFKLHEKAMIQFTYAMRLVPNYWMNYYYLGKSYEGMGSYNDASYQYRLAYRHNPYDLSSLVALGDLLTNRKDYSAARELFTYVLKQDSGFNDALIGMGKIDLFYRRYYSATLWFRSVDMRKPYKKEFHYYYGEAAFYAQLYPTASEQFSLMINYPQDAIFDKVSLSRVRLRLKQSRRLALQNEE